MNTICLVMIVKNEAEVIGRCLRSVLPHVQAALIIDTGSQDNTPDLCGVLCQQYLTSNWTVSDAEWKDFSYNRNMLLDRAKLMPGFDYILTIDADEELLTNGNQLPELTKDLYNLRTEYAGTVYTRPALFRNDGTFYYEGAVHEWLRRKGDEFISQENVDWWTIKVYHEGARSKDPETYRNDARLLEQTLARTNDCTTYEYARTLFYLAQSYRDMGKHLNAYEAYRRRAHLDSGWYHEKWYAYFMMARMQQMMGDHDKALLLYLDAYNRDSTRPEPLYYAAKMITDSWPIREMLLHTANELERPSQGLFLEPMVYDWLIPIELSVAMWYMGKKEQSKFLTHQLLNNPKLPEQFRKGLESNLQFH